MLLLTAGARLRWRITIACAAVFVSSADEITWIVAVATVFTCHRVSGTAISGEPFSKLTVATPNLHIVLASWISRFVDVSALKDRTLEHNGLLRVAAGLLALVCLIENPTVIVRQDAAVSHYPNGNCQVALARVAALIFHDD